MLFVLRRQGTPEFEEDDLWPKPCCRFWLRVEGLGLVDRLCLNLGLKVLGAFEMETNASN